MGFRDWKTFGTMKICPKCGHNDFDIVFVQEFTPIFYERVLIPEHLQITCKFCSYVENELPLDAKNEDEE